MSKPKFLPLPQIPRTYMTYVLERIHFLGIAVSVLPMKNGYLFKEMLRLFDVLHLSF